MKDNKFLRKLEREISQKINAIRVTHEVLGSTLLKNMLPVRIKGKHRIWYSRDSPRTPNPYSFYFLDLYFCQRCANTNTICTVIYSYISIDHTCAVINQCTVPRKLEFLEFVSCVVMYFDTCTRDVRGMIF